MNMNDTYNPLANRKPVATAKIMASDMYPNLNGDVSFYTAPGGTLVSARVSGLPPIALPTDDNPTQVGPFGFHIHEGANCGGNTGAEAFSAAGGHYNPTNQPHPLHAGDLPVLFPNNGYSEMQVFTDRFRPQDVVGRTVVIHQMPDDFRTQPSGDSGMRIGCGPIYKP